MYTIHFQKVFLWRWMNFLRRGEKTWVPGYRQDALTVLSVPMEHSGYIESSGGPGLGLGDLI